MPNATMINIPSHFVYESLKSLSRSELENYCFTLMLALSVTQGVLDPQTLNSFEKQKLLLSDDLANKIYSICTANYMNRN